MSLKTYVNKDGYKIRATEKAYKLFYQKQGFAPVSNQEAKETEKEQPDTSSVNQEAAVKATRKTKAAGKAKEAEEEQSEAVLAEKAEE